MKVRFVIFIKILLYLYYGYPKNYKNQNALMYTNVSITLRYYLYGCMMQVLVARVHHTRIKYLNTLMIVLS